jgi:hypothetical protein
VYVVEPFLLSYRGSGKHFRIGRHITNFFRKYGKLYLTTTRLRMLMEVKMKEGVERSIVTQAEREAAMRTLGHSATTVNRYYLPDDRYKPALTRYAAISIIVMSYNRLADARIATAAYDRFHQSGEEEAVEDMGQHVMDSDLESEYEEANMECDVEEEEEEAQQQNGMGTKESEDDNEYEWEEEEEEEAQQQHVMGTKESEDDNEYEWEEEEEMVEAQQLQQQVWGKLHPDSRKYYEGSNIRVPWSVAERGYVRKWIIENPDAPVRLLYEDVQTCTVARDIFHGNHVELDKISYMFKLLRKTML